MESTNLPTMPLLALSKTLKFSPKPYQLLAPKSIQSHPRCFNGFNPRRSRDLLFASLAGKLLRGPRSFISPWRGLASISTASFSSAGGGGGGHGNSDGGGGGGGSESSAVGIGEGSDQESDVIILDVGVRFFFLLFLVLLFLKKKVPSSYSFYNKKIPIFI